MELSDIKFIMYQQYTDKRYIFNYDNPIVSKDKEYLKYV